MSFERWTERARRALVLAQEEARALKHNYIGGEHLLLGLLREEEGLAAQVLGSWGITADRVRDQVVRIVSKGQVGIGGQIAFTPRAKSICEYALREALSLGHNYISTEHVLLGLTREEEGVATRILIDLGARAQPIREEIMRRLGTRQRASTSTQQQPMSERVKVAEILLEGEGFEIYQDNGRYRVDRVGHRSRLSHGGHWTAIHMLSKMAAWIDPEHGEYGAELRP